MSPISFDPATSSTLLLPTELKIFPNTVNGGVYQPITVTGAWGQEIFFVNILFKFFF